MDRTNWIYYLLSIKDEISAEQFENFMDEFFNLFSVELRID